jgi:hypothetical protein
MEIYGQRWFLFLWIIVFIILFNMIINFNTGFYKRGMRYMDRISILKYYAKSWFVWDALAIFPIIESFIHFPGYWRFINMIIFLQIGKIYDISTKYTEIAAMKK